MSPGIEKLCQRLGGKRSSCAALSAAGASLASWIPSPRTGREPAWVRPSRRAATSWISAAEEVGELSVRLRVVVP